MAQIQIQIISEDHFIRIFKYLCSSLAHKLPKLSAILGLHNFKRFEKCLPLYYPPKCNFRQMSRRHAGDEFILETI